MLDRRSLRALAEHPERNDPALNLALAEEGDAPVLFALAECASVGPEALATIALRVAKDGERVGHEPDPEAEDGVRRGSRREAEPEITNGTELDTRLVLHPRSDDAVRDAILARHPDDPFFALAAGAHARATTAALDLVARWPAATAMHDRPWLALIAPSAVPPLVLDAWAADADPLLREVAARIATEPRVLATLAEDASRRVRRALASNPAPPARDLRARLAGADPACEVRARAAAPLELRRDESDVHGSRGVDATSARFKDATLAMESGGTLAADVVRALRAGPLDREGARLAAQALDEGSLGSMVATWPLGDDIGIALAAGIAFREDVVKGGGEDDDDALLGRCVRALAGAAARTGVVTGKGRLAAWLAEGVASTVEHALGDVLSALGRTSLAADRMVLGQVVGRQGKRDTLLSRLAEECAASSTPVPVALVELAWKDARVSDETLRQLGARVRPLAKLEAAPEHEVDLDPRARPLDVLESVGSALVGKAPLSPRAALALVALEPRRVRYVLSALPQWKGVLAGVNVARVLRAHAGALSAAGPSAATSPRRPSGAAAATWTQRRLDEAELAVALAIGDLGATDSVARLLSGQDLVVSGTALAAGMEARAAIEGAKALEPLVELLARMRSQDAALLAAWLIVETLDRPRSAAAIAAALDAPWAVSSRGTTRAGAGPASARSMVAHGIAEALATLERRSPGRLAEVTPQTPRGRAALVSGIARAYRALGGMSVTET